MIEFGGDYAATSSYDQTVKLWDLRKNNSLATFGDHKKEVMDISFNSTGTMLSSCSADCTGKVYSVAEATTIGSLEGHEGPVSMIKFSP